jgi:hypothetical protein
VLVYKNWLQVMIQGSHNNNFIGYIYFFSPLKHKTIPHTPYILYTNLIRIAPPIPHIHDSNNIFHIQDGWFKASPPMNYTIGFGWKVVDILLLRGSKMPLVWHFFTTCCGWQKIFHILTLLIDCSDRFIGLGGLLLVVSHLLQSQSVSCLWRGQGKW